MTLFIGEENGSWPRVDWLEPGERVLPPSSLKKSSCRAVVLRNARDLNFSFVASLPVDEHSFVKSFVVLAILLLIPSIGYFHRQIFLSELKPRLESQVEGILKEEGVVDPGVRLDYLDAFISGAVDSDAQRARVVARVDGLSGVRVVGRASELRAPGWLRVEREKGRFRASGVVSEDLVVELTAPLKALPGWDTGLERREFVVDPVGVETWAEFLAYYFREQGDRSVELRKGRLTIGGDTTSGLRIDWLSKASEVVPKDMVSDELVLRSSPYHFPGYQPESLQNGTVLGQLRRKLNDSVVTFRPGSEELQSGDRDKVIIAARAIITAGEGARYAVGGHPARDGNATENSRLARLRAETVGKILVDQGVLLRQVETLSFGVAPGGDRDNQVEIMVK